MAGMRNVIGVAGWKNSGKTTLVAALVAELSRRGHVVSTVKHAHHDFDIDREGTDSLRHRRAGANEVAIVSSKRWALMHELRDEPEPMLDDMLEKLSPADIVVVEGFKSAPHAKIETRRREAADTRPLGPEANVVAIAADHDRDDAGVPVFRLNDIETIADFVESRFDLIRR